MMVLCDVNVLVYAMIKSTPHHALARRAVDELRASGERIAVSELVLAALVRITTHPKIFRPAADVADAFAFADAWRAHPKAVPIGPGARHWATFQDLVVATGIRGADTADAYLAALALEHGCEWWTTDAGFDRFAGLRTRNLLRS